MRLWHTDLIDVLPRKQLISQWREILYLKKVLIEKDSYNHVLVDVVMTFPLSDFKIYTDMVTAEIIRRGYKIDLGKYIDVMKWDGNNSFVCGDIEDMSNFSKPGNFSNSYAIFITWHNSAYLRQCLANLKEKYDRGSVMDNEWKVIDDKFHDIIKEMRI